MDRRPLSLPEVLAAIPQKNVWMVDFEYYGEDGERPTPVCLVAYELRSQQTIQQWYEDFGSEPPYDLSADSLFVAFSVPAECSCHAVLNWSMPKRVLDLYVEFKNLVNGLEERASLLSALAYFGLPTYEQEKTSTRDLILTGGPWTPDEKITILDYCHKDVMALNGLLPFLLPTLQSGALLRGRAMVSMARIEHCGIPIDLEMRQLFIDRIDEIKEHSISVANQEFPVFENGVLKLEKFDKCLVERDMFWPRTASGRLSLSDSNFEKMIEIYPQVRPLRDALRIRNNLKLSDVVVGPDGRNRCSLMPFQSRTGRCQPSNAKFIFGMASWLRGLIKPPPGYGIAYVDFSQQEIAIAAALSGDPNMIAAYETGDSYLGFAKAAGLVPADATKKSHRIIRDRCKACVLGVNYFMAEQSLALRIGQHVIIAKSMLDAHKQIYRVYWNWVQNRLHHAMLEQRVFTVFGWQQHVGHDPNPRQLGNFAMQSHGSEMLRLACAMSTEAGLSIAAPVHDAILLLSPLDRLDSDIVLLQKIMRDASAIVLNGFSVRTDPAIFKYPQRYRPDEEKAKMWDEITKRLGVSGE